MAHEGDISHNRDLPNWVKQRWTKLGENLGNGSEVGDVHEAMLASPSHRQNILDEDFTHLGVGVVVGNDGVMFTAHHFMVLRSPRPGTGAGPPRPAVRTRAPARPPEPVPAPPAERRQVAIVLEQLRGLDAAR